MALKGIHALAEPNVPLQSQILAAPIGGVALRYTWDHLAANGIGQVANDLAACHLAGKQASICVQAGRRCPPSLYAAGCEEFAFVDSYVSWLPDGSTQVCPVPWDPIFIARWTAFIKELGKVSSSPALAAVKVTGLNGRTEELSLPMHWGGPAKNPITGKVWNTTNDVKHWLTLGYLRTKVFEAWNEIFRAFVLAFPNTELVAQIVRMAWPPIGDGTLGSGNDDVLQGQIVQSLSDGDGLQSNDLCAFAPVNPVVTAEADVYNIGQQALWPVWGDISYRSNNGVPAKPDTILTAMLDRAVTAKCRWVELYLVDLFELAATVSLYRSQF